jgi:hypothetical protein
MFRILAVELCIAMLALMESGCDKSEDDDKPKENNTGITRADHSGRGTKACQDWQFYYCEYITVRCDFDNISGSFEECLTVHSAMVCLSDDTASECADIFSSVPRCAVPTTCLFDDVVDPEPAIEQCGRFATALCQREIDCGSDISLEGCTDDQSTDIGCRNVIGTALSYEGCMDTIEALSCSDPLPEECENIFILR